MDKRTPQLAEAIGEQVIAGFLPTILAWHEGTNGPPEHRVHPKSPLGNEDKLTDPWQTSHAARSLLGNAADHLNTFRTIFMGDGTQYVLPLFSMYSLLRPALECHAAALFLLGPPQRERRLRNRFKIGIADLVNRDVAEALVRDDFLGDPHGITRERMLDQAVELGLSRDDLSGRPIGSAKILRDVAPFTNLPADTLELLWRLMSGMAHGQQWAALASLDREEVIDAARDEFGSGQAVAHVRMTSSLAYVAVMLRYTMVVGAKAHRRFNKLSRPAPA